jgi:hypothetical protein
MVFIVHVTERLYFAILHIERIIFGAYWIGINTGNELSGE